MTKTSAVLVGQAVGDSLGMPFEHFADGVHPDLAAWDGTFKAGTYHKLPRGHWTDDTEMAECLARSLVAKGGFDGEDVARRYLAWSQGTPHGMGGTTREAMRRLAEGASWTASGVTFADQNAVGSGPPMRAAPIGMLQDLPTTVHGTCLMDAWITHASWEAVSASYAVAMAVRLAPDRGGLALLRDVTALVANAERQGYCVKHGPTKVSEDLGYAVGFLQAGVPVGSIVPQPFSRRGNARSIVATALYCACACDDFRTGVIAAVRLGGDTDTRGAIAGAVLGARFGLEGIPDEYKRDLLRFEDLCQLDRQLVDLSKKRKV
jgi:ADP-ribosyl-[dinitrogen reductase] hydrolase